MTEPTDALPNLGPKSRVWLAEIGIKTAADLNRRGAVAAYLELKKRNPRVSLIMLYAMHAALQDRDWRDVTDDEKDMLRTLVTEADGR